MSPSVNSAEANVGMIERDWLDASEDEDFAPGQSRLISRVLTPAIRLWVKSQLEFVEDLQIAIHAGDRQILGGAVSCISVAANKAIYRGLHLSQIQIQGEKIRTNLGQVMRGKPLRLLDAFPIRGQIILRQSDLNASLRAALLRNAVEDFLTDAIPLHPSSEDCYTLRNPQVVIEAGRLILTTQVAIGQALVPVCLQTGLHMEAGNRLCLDRPQWLLGTEERQFSDLPPQVFELGSHVYLEELVLEPGKMRCQGRITVLP